MYQDLCSFVESNAQTETFDAASNLIEARVNQYPLSGFMQVLVQIGTIPERFAHDSTEEKLYSKASDCVLARAFRELGLKSAVLKERGDSADVRAESPVYGYRLAADAKAFRMSRTAKNQKDFKVAALSGWRKDADYAVLCAPYFQYPGSASQIYAQALEYGVCLLSWEHLVFLIQKNCVENRKRDFSHVWNFCEYYSGQILHSERKNCFLPSFDRAVMDISESNEFPDFLAGSVEETKKRGQEEITYWKREIARIERFSREQAVQELIEAKKINQKIRQIEVSVRRLKRP